MEENCGKLIYDKSRYSIVSTKKKKGTQLLIKNISEIPFYLFADGLTNLKSPFNDHNLR